MTDDEPEIFVTEWEQGGEITSLTNPNHVRQTSQRFNLVEGDILNVLVGLNQAGLPDYFTIQLEGIEGTTAKTMVGFEELGWEKRMPVVLEIDGERISIHTKASDGEEQDPVEIKLIATDGLQALVLVTPSSDADFVAKP